MFRHHWRLVQSEDGVHGFCEWVSKETWKRKPSKVHPIYSWNFQKVISTSLNAKSGHIAGFGNDLYSSSRYDEAPLQHKPYRQKDGALLAIGALCDKLKQTEPYKSELERMLVQHVFPEFSSPVGHLRAKVCFTRVSFASPWLLFL